MIGLLIVLLFVAALCGLMLTIIAWTLRPMVIVDGRHVGPDHYTLADIACLTVYVAGLIAIVRAVETGELEAIALTLAIGSAVVMWWGTIRVLSRAMVGRPIKRVAFMVVVPITLLLAVVIVATPFVGMVKFAQLHGTLDQLSPLATLFAVSLAIGSSSLILFGLNRVTTWIVRHDEFSNRVGGVTAIEFRVAEIESQRTDCRVPKQTSNLRTGDHE